MRPALKRLLGSFLLVIFILGYCIAVATLAGPVIAEQHWAVQILFFMFAGVIWAPVVKPLMLWMRRT